MNTKQQLEKLLLDSIVLSNAWSYKILLESQEGKKGGVDTLYYQPEDSPMRSGTLASDNLHLVHKMAEVEDAGRLIWHLYGEERIRSQIGEFTFFHYKPQEINRESGMLVLTNWRLNLSCPQTNRKLMRAMSGSVTPHPSSLHLMPTLYDCIALNELKGHHPNAVFVRGEFQSKDSERAHLLVLQQNAPYMARKDVELLANAYSLVTFSALRGRPIDDQPEFKEMLAENHYTQFKGILDIERREIELEEF